MKPRKSRVVFVMLFFITVLLGAAAIFIGYRLSEEEDVTPEESQAAGGWGLCCIPDPGCTTGYECVQKPCYQELDPSQNASKPCGDGYCHSWHTCENGKCIADTSYTCEELGACELGSGVCVDEFKKLLCEWPNVFFCGAAGGQPEFRCGHCDSSVDVVNACEGNPPEENDVCCDLNPCPDGMILCGNSTDDPTTFSDDCVKQTNNSCTVFHPDCRNPSIIYQYCKEDIDPLVCGDPCDSDSDCGDDLFCENEDGDTQSYCVYDEPAVVQCGVNDYVDPTQGGVCECPPPPGCGEACEEDDDCDGSLICEKPGSDRLCVGTDFEECNLQEHLDNSCSCPEETLDCKSLTADGTGVIQLTQGESATEILDAASSGTADEGLVYDFDVESGFGSLDPSTQSGGTSTQASWSISGTETAALDAGETYENKIWVTISKEGLGTFGGAESEVCSLDLQVAAGNANFNAEKTASVVCSDDNTEAVISYEISFTNVADFQTLITSVEDVYDELIDGNWVDNIAPTPDLHSGGSILWDNEGYGFILDASESKVMTYEVTVPSDLFGKTLHNTATIIPEIGEQIVLEEDVIVNCTLPPTGIVDKTVIGVLYALFFIITGALTVRYFGSLDFVIRVSSQIWPISVIAENSGWNKNERFEKKIVKDIEDKFGDG